MKSRLVYRPLLWLAIVLLLWWSLGQSSLDEISTVLTRLTPGQILLLLLINIGIFLAFSLRWWWFLRSLGGGSRFWRLSLYRLSAFGITYFTPGPQFGGEPYQVLALRAREGVPLPAALSSVALDKLIELIANFSFLLFGLLLLVRGGLLTGLNGWSTLPLILVVLSLPAGYVLFVWRGRLPLSAGSQRLGLLLPRSIRAWFAKKDRLTAGFSALLEAETAIADVCKNQPVLLALALSISGVTWLALIGEYHLALRFLGLDLSFSQTILTLTAARVAFLLPIPAGLGTLEASQILAMEAMGMSPAIGVSMSLLIRARDVLFGGVGLWISGLGEPRRWKPLLRE